MKLLLLLGGLVVVGVAVVVVMLGAGYWMWSSEPTYWQDHQQRIANLAPAERARMAQDVQTRFISQLTAIRQPDSPGATPPARSRRLTDAGAPAAVTDDDYADARLITLGFDEVNAWLGELLEDWIANRGEPLPQQVGDFMVAPEDDRLVVAFRIDSPQISQIVSVVFDLDMLPDGKARLNVHEVRGGRLPIPLATLAEQLPTRPGTADADLQRAVNALQGMSFEPRGEIDSSRQAELVDYEIHADRVDLYVKVSPRD